MKQPEWPAELEPVSLRFADIDARVLALTEPWLAFRLRSFIPMAVIEGKLKVGFARPPKQWELDQIATSCQLPVTVARVGESELERALEDWDASIVEPETEVQAVDAPYTEAHRRLEKEHGLAPLEDLMLSHFFELRIWDRHSQGLGLVRLARERRSGPFHADYFFDDAERGEGRGGFEPIHGWAPVWLRLKDGARIAELPAEENVNPTHFYLGGFQPYVQVLLEGRIQRRSYALPDDRRTPSARRVQMILDEMRRALREAGVAFQL